MAILSAGINFGKPQTEFIVESDESGVIQSCRNVVTGVEYAGGGGGGDFTTAEVTITLVNFSPSILMYDCPICVEDNALEGIPACIISQFILDTSGVYKVPLYKGQCAWFDFYTLFEDVTIDLSGDLSKESNTIVITGDGVITITAE